jgi:hypothetical protein
MRTFVCLSVLLGLAAFLTIHYSFWLAVGIMYIGVMLIVAVIAFAARSRQTVVSSYVVLDDKHCQTKVDEQTVSEEFKAA